MATLVVGESINVKSMWIPALDAVSKALEKARALESNKEQRYLLRLVSTEIQQQQQLLATAPSTPRVTSTSTAVAAASPPASPGRPTSAGSVSPQRGQTGVTPAANGAPAAATTSGIDELSFTMNRVATVVRGYLLHTLAQNRSNQRIVEATLELSHALLNSGVLPVDAQWAPANIPIPSSVNASMLTKMLGTWGSRSTTTEPHAEGSAAPHPPSVAAATMNPFDEIATLNVKVALCVPNQIESPGLYTAITSLLGAVVPDRVSCIDRTCPQQTSFIPSGSFIGLSGPALQTHAYLLFALAVRATTSNMPTLLTIVKGGLSRLIGAIVKELDRHHNRAVRGSSMGPLAADSTNPTPSTRSVTPTPTTSSNALNQHLRSSSVAPQQQGRYEPATVTLHHDVAVLIGIATYFTSDTLMAASKDDISKLIALVPISLTRSSESRALCLTYILQFFVNGGPGMRKSPILLHCIQQTLFPAVLKTALSNEIDVYRLSLNILYTLYNNFYAELMVECGMFFQHVLFQILASQNASVSQKVLALEVVKLIAEEPKNLLNMYLNYDCDTNSTNVYETLLYHLDVLATGTSKRTRGGDQATSPLAKTTGSSSAAASTGSTPPPTAARVPQLQCLALDTLLCIAEAHHQWVERFVEGGTKQPTPSYVESSPSPNVGAMLSEGDVDTNDETTTTTAALTTSLAPHFVGLGAMDGDGDLLSAEPSYSNFSASTVTMSGMDLSHVFDTKKKKRLTEKFLKLFNTEKSAERALAFLEGDGQDILPSDETLPEPLSRDRRAASYAALKNTTTSLANSMMTPGGVPADLPQLSPKASDSPSAPAATPAHPLLDEAAEFAQRVAVLWYSLDGSLDRLVLGDFFAKGFRKELHQTIFKMWIELHDFRNKAIDVALRQFLGGFKLLGEAQVVDRTMEVFAAHYCRMNPSAFSSANTAFILSFTICMLNTDAHSIHVVDKMSKEAFIRMNKGVDDGKDLDSELLSSIYDRITSKEIKLRPLKARSLAHGGAMHGTQTGAAAVGRKSNIAVAVLGSIPILRRLVPIAETIGDAVMIPVDAAGNILFNTAQRKRSQNYSAEFHEVFREAMSMLREHQNTIGEGSLTVDSNDSDHHRRQGSIEGTSTPSLNGTQSSMIMFVEADSLEHALPMWDLTVEIVVDALLVALQEACSVVRYATKDEVGAATGDDAAAQHGLGTSPPLGPEGSVSNGHFAETSPGYTEGMARVEQLIKGVLVTVRVCAALGALPHAHRMLERLFQLSTLQQVITLQRHDKKLAVCTVKVTQRIPSACLRCAVAVLEALAVNGNVCTADMWSIGYQIVSYIDALSTFLRENSRVAKGESGGTSPTTGGMYSSRRSLQHAVSVNLPTPNVDTMATVPAPPKSTTLPSTQPSAFAAAAANLSSDAAQPSHIATAAELQKCQQILDDLYAVSPYLLWVERLYDVTSASSQSLLQMVNGLCKVCVEELEVGRIFSLSRLTEFCTVCTTIVSRMQWRDLWANCEPLFVAAGSKDSAIALQAIDGLKGIAYHYLLKEELSLYKFQKELLQPFERILMRNNEKDVRVAIIRAVHDMIENRSVQLASGWSVILSLLSRGALIPELVHMSWSGCKQLVTRHLPHLSECFHDFIFCLTSFASNTADVHIAFQGASYLVACGTWLQVGLVPLPPCFEEDEDAEEAAALRSPSDSTSSAHKSSVDGGDDDNTSVEGSSSLNGSSMLSMDDAALAPQHGYDLLQASLDVLDPPGLVDGLEACTSVAAMRALCEGGGCHLAQFCALSPEEWRTCCVPPTRMHFSSPDEELDVMKRVVRTADRLRRDGSQLIPKFEVLCRAPRPPMPLTVAGSPANLVQHDFGFSITGADFVPNLSCTAAGFAATAPAVNRTCAPLPALSSTMFGEGPVQRVLESDEPISATRKLVRPTDFTQRTEYNLWASLFEGLVPIIFAHSDTRARLHAVRCLWELVRRFARFFDKGVQLSLLSPLLRSAVSALATDETLLPQSPRARRSSVASPADIGSSSHPHGAQQQALYRKYRGIMQTSLRGMLYACSTDAHLLTLACDSIQRAATYAKNPRCLKAGLVSVLVSLVSEACSPTSSACVSGDDAQVAALTQSNVSWWITQAHPEVFRIAKGHELLAGIVERSLLPSVMEAWDASVSESAASFGGGHGLIEWLPSMTSARQIWDLCATLANRNSSIDSGNAVRWANTLRGAAQRHTETLSTSTRMFTATARYLASLRRKSSSLVATPAALTETSTIDGMQLILPSAMIVPSLCLFLKESRPSPMTADMFTTTRTLVTGLLDAITWTSEVLWGLGPNVGLLQSSLLTLHQHNQDLKSAAGVAVLASTDGGAAERQHRRRTFQWLATFSYQTFAATMNYIVTAAAIDGLTPCGQLLEPQELLALIPRLPNRGDLTWDARGSLCQSIEEHVLALESLAPSIEDAIVAGGSNIKTGNSWKCPHASVMLDRVVLLIRRTSSAGGAGVDSDDSDASTNGSDQHQDDDDLDAAQPPRMVLQGTLSSASSTVSDLLASATVRAAEDPIPSIEVETIEDDETPPNVSTEENTGDLPAAEKAANVTNDEEKADEPTTADVQGHEAPATPRLLAVESVDVAGTHATYDADRTSPEAVAEDAAAAQAAEEVVDAAEEAALLKVAEGDLHSTSDERCR